MPPQSCAMSYASIFHVNACSSDSFHCSMGSCRMAVYHTHCPDEEHEVYFQCGEIFPSAVCHSCCLLVHTCRNFFRSICTWRFNSECQDCFPKVVLGCILINMHHNPDINKVNAQALPTSTLPATPFSLHPGCCVLPEHPTWI